MQNYEKTILSQYANSPILLALIESFNADVDPSSNIQNFYDFVWNVDSAKGYGLDVWGRIVGVSRVLQLDTQFSTFGFEEPASQSLTGFNQAPFYYGRQINNNFVMSDAMFYVMILVKAFFNITRTVIPNYNYALRNLMPFVPGVKNWYISDNLNMTVRMVIEYDGIIPKYLINAIVRDRRIFKLPTGVGLSGIAYVYSGIGGTFGFEEAHASTFNNGIFYQG